MKYLAQAIAAAALIVVSILGYQHFTDPRRAEEIGRLKGELSAAKREGSIAHAARIAASRRLDSALSRTDTVVTRWRTRVVHDTVRLAAATSPHDSVVVLSQALTETQRAGDSVVRACSDLAGSCRLFRATATAEIASWERKYAVLDSLHRVPRPGKRWNLSLSLGYGAGMRGDTLVRSPFVGVSVGRSILAW